MCAQLVGEDRKPLEWGPKGDFWLITGQKQWQWDEQIRSEPNPGDSWCICMWAFARLVKTVGCENVHFRCDSTDLKYVLSSYHDGGVDLEPAHACIKQKCPTAIDQFNL